MTQILCKDPVLWVILAVLFALHLALWAWIATGRSKWQELRAQVAANAADWQRTITALSSAHGAAARLGVATARKERAYAAYCVAMDNGAGVDDPVMYAYDEACEEFDAALDAYRAEVAD